MPPKTIRKRSEEVDVKVTDEGIIKERTELLLTSGLDIEFTVFVNCSDYYMHELSSKEYALGAYRNVDHFDYVDLYIDGEMVAEGEPEIVDTYEPDEKPRGSFLYYNGIMQYVFTSIENVRLFGTMKRSMFGERLSLKDDRNRHKVRAILYYLGNEIITKEITFEPESNRNVDADLSSMWCRMEFDKKEMKKAVTTYGR